MWLLRAESLYFWSAYFDLAYNVSLRESDMTSHT